MTAVILIHIILWIGLSVFYSSRLRLPDKIVFQSYFLMKVLCAVLFSLLYWYYYNSTGDTIYFFEQAGGLYRYLQNGTISFNQFLGFEPANWHSLAISAANEQRNFFFVRLITPLFGLTEGTYFLMVLDLSLLSGVSCWFFVRQLISTVKVPKRIAYISFLFLPSLLFWSSSLLKESIMISTLFCVLALLIRYSKYRRLYILLLAIPLLFILWQIKYYVPIVLIPILLLTYIFTSTKILYRPYALGIYFLTIIVGVLLLGLVHPVFHSGRFFELVQISYDVVANKSSDAFYFVNTSSDILFVMLNFPLAILTALFRPLLFEVSSTLQFISAIEHTLILGFTLYIITIMPKIRVNRTILYWLLALIIYVFALSGILALSTPNFGSLSRYQIAFMPFYTFLLLFLYHHKRVKNS